LRPSRLPSSLILYSTCPSFLIHQKQKSSSSTRLCPPLGRISPPTAAWDLW
jgi:hypothetical protein